MTLRDDLAADGWELRDRVAGPQPLWTAMHPATEVLVHNHGPDLYRISRVHEVVLAISDLSEEQARELVPVVLGFALDVHRALGARR